MSTSYALAGKLFSCPTNKYISATNTCLSCPSANSCNGSAASSWGSTQVSSDGSCFNCPGDFTCSNTNLDSDSPCPAGSYINSNSVVSCPAGSSCINGYKTSCVSGTTWALASYTGWNYWPPNYVWNQTPTSCSNGQYLSSLTSQTWSACSAGFICIQDWAGQIAIYPGTYAASSSSSWTECPASYSCTSSAATTCSSYTYSGQGETSCDSTPTFLTVSSSTSRSPVSVSVIGRGSSANTDTASSSCGSSNYCPGLDGGSYSIPEGITISGASITSKAPGTSCTAGTSGTSGSYSNGGNDWGTYRTKILNEKRKYKIIKVNFLMIWFTLHDSTCDCINKIINFVLI